MKEKIQKSCFSFLEKESLRIKEVASLIGKTLRKNSAPKNRKTSFEMKTVRKV